MSGCLSSSDREKVLEVYTFSRDYYDDGQREYKSKFSETKIGNKFIGRIIRDVDFTDTELKLYFVEDPETYLLIKDQEVQCCERRYMKTDDDLRKELIGNKLKEIELKHVIYNVIDHESGYPFNVCSFLEIKTDECFVNIKSYLEYENDYGGLDISIMEMNQTNTNDI